MDFIELPVDLLQVISPEHAWGYQIIPKYKKNNTVCFYAEQTHINPTLINELEMVLGLRVLLEPAEKNVIEKTLGKYYRKSKHTGVSHTRLNSKDETDNFLLSVLKEAKQIGSSDVHFEAYENGNRIRLRIDGLLVERFTIDSNDYLSLINQIKIKSNLDITEKRLPQDGRISFEENGEQIDVRVSVLPTRFGEKAVLRLLTKESHLVHLDLLGFSKQDYINYKNGISKPHGIVLISGPTGSGKTTTLYATINELNKTTRNILTIEDPIEYTMEGINQVQLKEDIGLTFSAALRTFLRQDPDIIMLGEIRDQETASMAIRASLTGHLLLSTIHTNSAWGTITRLIDMGIEPFLIASTLNLSVAQRLVRLLCPDCKTKKKLDASDFAYDQLLSKGILEHYTAKGCDTCFYTGYRGRKAIFEVLPVDEEVAEKIKRKETDISEYTRRKQIKVLSENAFELVATGSTSIEEIYSLMSV